MEPNHRRMPPAQRPEEQQPPTPSPTQKPTVPDYVDTFNADMDALAQSERKRLQTERDRAAGLARLQQYADEQGLAETEENAALVQKFLDEKVKGYWSAAGVDAVIANLRSQLKWRPKVAPTPPPPPAEPVRLLDNGQPELPLNASFAQMRAASKDQLQDLSRRRGEGRQPHLGRLTARF